MSYCCVMRRWAELTAGDRLFCRSSCVRQPPPLCGAKVLPDPVTCLSAHCDKRLTNYPWAVRGGSRNRLRARTFSPTGLAAEGERLATTAASDHTRDARRIV